MKFSLLKYGVAFGSLLSALLVACATQVAPSGGPEDKLPPRVAGVYPAPNTTNHPNELMVKLEFDEWINASIPRSAVSISPPPFKVPSLSIFTAWTYQANVTMALYTSFDQMASERPVNIFHRKKTSPSPKEQACLDNLYQLIAV